MQFYTANRALFTKAEAKALAAHASTDKTRPHLNCVCIDFARGSAVATDGHRLAKSNFAASFAGAAQCLVPLAKWQRAIKACSKKNSGILVERYMPGTRDHVTLTALEPGSLQLETLAHPVDGPEDLSRWTLATIRAVCTEAKFPPYEQIIPSTEGRSPAAMLGINTHYLADLQLVALAAGERTMGVQVFLGAELDPVIFKSEGPAGSWLAIVMPMRI